MPVKDVRVGQWVVHNLKGISKRFKDIDSEEARKWMSSKEEPVAKEPKVKKAKES